MHMRQYTDASCTIVEHTTAISIAISSSRRNRNRPSHAITPSDSKKQIPENPLTAASESPARGIQSAMSQWYRGGKGSYGITSLI